MELWYQEKTSLFFKYIYIYNTFFPRIRDCINMIIFQVKKSKSIIIVGGGATGVETAVEFAVAYPDKEITIVHNSLMLLTDKMTERSQQFLQNQLTTQFHIKLVLGKVKAF